MNHLGDRGGSGSLSGFDFVFDAQGVIGDPTGDAAVEIRLRETLDEHGLAERTIRTYTNLARRAAAFLGSYDALFVADASELRHLATMVPLTASAQRQLKSTLQYFYAAVGRDDAPVHSIFRQDYRSICMRLVS